MKTNPPNGKFPMTVRELYEQGISLLSELETPKTDARAILEYVLNLEFGKLPLMFPENATEISGKYLSLIKERANNKPLSYITGKKEFFSRDFHVREGVLIPRPETENLVSAVLERLPDKPVRIADVCSGSGCIGITLALESSNPVDLYELSPEAIAVSQKNAEQLNANKIQIFQTDILSESLRETYDIIVSNPPYIPLSDMDLLMPDVVDYEPKMALTDGGDGLLFYRRLVVLAEKHLADDGILAVEVGINLHTPVAELMAPLGKVEIIPDYFGVERVVLVKKGAF
ncbi:MAG: peptide chain release factor N(5)-glutamine methyltransferase [Clostridia bacterium]|nr:peptide chain release factor N(5)-glutamine methyltransferase [Clostridia bacterium]